VKVKRLCLSLCVSAISVMALCGGAVRAWAAPAATTTTLAVTSAGTTVTTVASGSVVTLTASVIAGITPVTIGQVKFCDAAATYCTDIHLLGTRQLTSAGTATLKFVPGIGSHSYKAIFSGTTSDVTSASGDAALTVTGTIPTTTSIAANGSAGNYTLTATVTGSGGAVSPTGTVSFLDITSGNTLLGSAGLGKSAATLNWTNSSNPATGLGPYSVAVGDFNGNGIPDLAVANYDGTLTILLGNGNGTFTQATNSPVTVGSEPFSVVVGDFNGDGIPDLAVANFGSSTVTILLGNGNGTFTQATKSPVTVGSEPYFIAVGDFNKDGIPDLAVTSYITGTITVLLGDGNGNFTATAASPYVGSGPTSIAVGDFNGDGIPDLVVTNQNSGNVLVLLGKGDGSFSGAMEQVSDGLNPVFVAVGDFNGDGILDLAVANANTNLTGRYNSNTVTVLLGNGDGTFNLQPSIPANGTNPQSIAVGDFNGDGIPDLAIAMYGSGSPSSAWVLLGKGDGTFSAAGNIGAGGVFPYSIAAGDFNGDGIPDLAMANYGSDTLTVVLSQLTQTGTARSNGISPVGTGTHLIAASYPGDNSYTSSTSATTGLTAQQLTPSVTVTPNPTSITTAQALSVTVAVSGGSGNPTPTGTVTLSSGSYTSAVTSLSSGSATISIPAGSLATGTDTLTASYTGDSNYSAKTGTAPVSVTVAVAPGASLTGTWQITGKSTAFGLTFTGTGTVQQTGSSVTGQITLSGSPCASTAALSGGIFGTTVTVQLLEGSQTVNFTGAANSGLTSISGTYTAPSGGCTNGDYGTWTATITAPTPGLTVSGTAVTVIPGATTGSTSTITVTPAGGFTGNVVLTAAVTSSPTGAQYPPTLSFGSTSPVSITGTSAGTATLTITTTAASSAALVLPKRNGVPWYAAGGAALACILLFGIPARRRSWRTMLGMLVFLVALSGGVLACGGGGGGSTGGGGTSNPGTTAGTYTVTVTGTSGATTATGMVTLNVQ